MWKGIAKRRDERGFTLIELLIVVVIIGILAAIAIPQFTDTKDQAYVATLKSDLRNAMTQMETEFASSLSYASISNSDLNYSDAVTMTVNGEAAGYCIEATHDQLGTTSPWHVWAGDYSGSPSGTEGVPTEGGC